MIFKKKTRLCFVVLSLLFFVSSLAKADSARYGTENVQFLPEFSWSGSSEVTAASSPDNSHALFIKLIQESRRNINLTGYMLRSQDIADALEAAAKRRVKVTILLDGWTVGRPKTQKIDPYELLLAQNIVNAGGKVLYIKSDTGGRTDRRFRYVHAKYAVIDDETIFISSENFASNGFAPNQDVGSRGWMISIQNRETAKAYNKIFAQDITDSAKYHDLAVFGRSADYTLTPAAKKLIEIPQARSGNYESIGEASTVRGNFTFERIISPDDTMETNRGIIGAIKNADKTLDIQSLTFSPHWGTNLDTIESNPSPIAEAVLDAARRGVRVRILVNPPIFFTKSKTFLKEENNDGPQTLWQDIAKGAEEFALINLPFVAAKSTPEESRAVDTKDNGHLLTYVRSVAKKERLDLQAHYFFVDEQGLRILHNKGMIVDGEKTLISSINWGENSMKNNREVAVLVGNTKIADYYEKLFNLDWKKYRNPK